MHTKQKLRKFIQFSNINIPHFDGVTSTIYYVIPSNVLDQIFLCYHTVIIPLNTYSNYTSTHTYLLHYLLPKLVYLNLYTYTLLNTHSNLLHYLLPTLLPKLICIHTP